MSTTFVVLTENDVYRYNQERDALIAQRRLTRIVGWTDLWVVA